MKFNEGKCSVIYFGCSNPKKKYKLNNMELTVKNEERDLGVMIKNNLKSSGQVDKAVLTANRVLGMISRSIETKTKDVVIPLYRALVRPHLEYCVQVWRPFLIKDIEKLEKVKKEQFL